MGESYFAAIEKKAAGFKNLVYGTDISILETVLYQILMYLHLDKFEFLKEGETTVYDILEMCRKVLFDREVFKITDSEKREIADNFPMVEAMVKRLEHKRVDVGSAIINDISWITDVKTLDELYPKANPGSADKIENYPLDGMQACTFRRDGILFVSYRGTPAGAWLDNGYGIIGLTKYTQPFKNEKRESWKLLSPMQVKEAEYARYIAFKYAKSGLRAVAGGHSKGANGAQLAVLMYPDFFDVGYSFDGQGMSPEFIGECRKIWGESEFKRRCGKIYGISYVNDYVHPLGISVIPYENRMSLGDPSAAERKDTLEEQLKYLAGAHSLAALVDCEKGELIPAYYAGGVNSTGPVAIFMRKISEVIMGMSPNQREEPCLFLMGALQVFYAKHEPTESNLNKIQYIMLIRDAVRGITPGILIILLTALETEEGKVFMDYLKRVVDIEELKSTVLENVIGGLR